MNYRNQLYSEGLGRSLVGLNILMKFIGKLGFECHDAYER